jgi:CCR4-NOT transcription complex subunit 1
MSITLPDPHLRNINFDLIPEMGPIPPIRSDFASGLQSAGLRNNLDQYLLHRGTPSFPTTLPSVPEGLSKSYNLSLINSLVMNVGASSVAHAKARSGSSVFVSRDPGVIVLQYLAANLDIDLAILRGCVYKCVLS